MEFGVRVQVARQNSDLSQSELAQKLGVSRGAVANWESGNEMYPTVSRLIMIAEITQVSVDWLVTGRGPMLPGMINGEIPAVDGEFVYEGDERRLLNAFRACTKKSKISILQSTEMIAGEGNEPLGVERNFLVP